MSKAAVPAFGRFIAIDWSGARGKRYAGIAVAECGTGDTPPRLVEGPGGWWSRTAVFDWLRAELAREPAPVGPTLVGIDCAFSLPFAVAALGFAGREATVFDLWDAVEEVCAAEPDFGGGPFASHPLHGVGFWHGGPQPDWYEDPHRATEWACRADGLGHPQSPYKLIGSRQVGKGALAGMRVLRALRVALPGRLAVWPFEEPAPGRSVMVEIYPRLFLKHTGIGQRKIRDGAEMDEALRRLGSQPLKVAGPVSDHDSDALVSAAGLRWLAGTPRIWAPPGLDDTARRQEGWIFGVGMSGS
ncbi:hypothetical protein TSH100_11150 [Azospirillum sp. TSH100]|uniref:hypothetical protein n=1 Tax=Azospirillum sp. TSH100 TaxID=652764 RepID=UPI000D619A25|nr:hypothetical protein [Azospirillum sp. TSH100]PWC86939.1 hypothetical protein TSH100_11150 [Azospirillum sp. TSH100]QCG91575.1 hypothetical protein E6C72_27735 [Azospirillum sp. TSH100]